MLGYPPRALSSNAVASQSGCCSPSCGSSMSESASAMGASLVRKGGKRTGEIARMRNSEEANGEEMVRKQHVGHLPGIPCLASSATSSMNFWLYRWLTLRRHVWSVSKYLDQKFNYSPSNRNYHREYQIPSACVHLRAEHGKHFIYLPTSSVPLDRLSSRNPFAETCMPDQPCVSGQTERDAKKINILSIFGIPNIESEG